jgi:hypothetical protein
LIQEPVLCKRGWVWLSPTLLNGEEARMHETDKRQCDGLSGQRTKGMRDGGTAYRYMLQHGIAGWAMIWVWAPPGVLVVERVHGLAPALISVASAAPAQVVMARTVGARVLVISRWQLREGRRWRAPKTVPRHGCVLAKAEEWFTARVFLHQPCPMFNAPAPAPAPCRP